MFYFVLLNSNAIRPFLCRFYILPQLSKPIEDASFTKGIQRYLKFEKGASKKNDKAAYDMKV